MLSRPLSIERDDPIQRARKAAALTRVVLGLLGVILSFAKPTLLSTPALGVAGFAIIVLTALLQLADLRVTWVQVEESIAASAAVLIIGLGEQDVTAALPGIARRAARPGFHLAMPGDPWPQPGAVRQDEPEPALALA